MSPRHLSLLAAALILLGGTVAIAKPAVLFGRHHPQPETNLAAGPGAESDGWLRNLNLTPEQTQKVRSIRNQHKDTLAQQRQALGQAQRQLREMMTSAASAEQIRQQYAQVKTLREQLFDTQFNSLLKTREVLTVEQRRRFADQMKQRRGRRGGRGAGEMQSMSSPSVVNPSVATLSGSSPSVDSGALFYE
jgi:periplasmic protein CpxP/Spy